MKLTKSQRQKKEYDRRCKQDIAWELFENNVSKLNELFHENYKHNYCSWDTFCNQHKNNQTNSIKHLHFKKNMHKSVTLWKRIVSTILRQSKKLTNVSRTTEDKHNIALQSENMSLFLNRTIHEIENQKNKNVNYDSMYSKVIRLMK